MELAARTTDDPKVYTVPQCSTEAAANAWPMLSPEGTVATCVEWLRRAQDAVLDRDADARIMVSLACAALKGTSDISRTGIDTSCLLAFSQALGDAARQPALASGDTEAHQRLIALWLESGQVVMKIQAWAALLCYQRLGSLPTGAGPLDRDVWLPASFLAQRTGGLLTTDSLLKAKDARRLKAERRGRLWYYQLAGVLARWPQHRRALLSALE